MLQILFNWVILGLEFTRGLENKTGINLTLVAPNVDPLMQFLWITTYRKRVGCSFVVYGMPKEVYLEGAGRFQTIKRVEQLRGTGFTDLKCYSTGRPGRLNFVYHAFSL
jgi:hypothetical protein